MAHNNILTLWDRVENWGETSLMNIAWHNGQLLTLDQFLGPDDEFAPFSRLRARYYLPTFAK